MFDKTALIDAQSQPPAIARALLCTTDQPPVGYRVTKVIGMVTGVIVRQDMYKIKLLTSKENQLQQHLDNCQAARDQAWHKLAGEAAKLGANAVVGIRFENSSISEHVIRELCCYGTAVVVEEAGK